MLMAFVYLLPVSSAMSGSGCRLHENSGYYVGAVGDFFWVYRSGYVRENDHRKLYIFRTINLCRRKEWLGISL